MSNYKCECGWVGHTPKKKSKNKLAFLACPTCAKVVQKYVIPDTEKIGRCGNCGHGSFKLKVENGQLHRTCKACEEKINPDTMEVLENAIF